MDALERRCQITEVLCLEKHIAMRELAARFHVSTRTIRSDNDECIETVFSSPSSRQPERSISIAQPL